MIQFDLFRLNRQLMTVTSVRNKELDIVLGEQNKQSKPKPNRNINDLDHSPLKGHDDYDHHEERDSENNGSADEEKLEPDYKGFDYVINYSQNPKHAPAVFTNLEDAVFGNI